MYVEKMTFVQKICTYNVDEIDTYRQFHQHWMYKFFVQTSVFYVHVTREKLQKQHS